MVLFLGVNDLSDFLAGIDVEQLGLCAIVTFLGVIVLRDSP
jgi:hypothetical protein